MARTGFDKARKKWRYVLQLQFHVYC